ncbi:MAG: ShlB/FhaC/HecB family hemolysin secretion/activation protein [Alphaproteobacteria bacterium]|nr:ShlB/FhaC/HecB family hemolysin secretion/activation protein [Alphaproteobacteria bacterium]
MAALTPEQRAQLPPGTLTPDVGGRLDQRFREAPVPSPATPAPSLEVEQPPPEQAPDSAGSIPLQLESVTLVGMTVYAAGELEAYWKDRIGKPGTLGDLFAIASAITTRYRNDGYVLSRAVVPAQEIEGGRVTIRVIEGYVDKVVFEGDDDRPGLLRGYGEAITAARPVRVSDLERYLLLINDQPGATASAVLRPSTDQTGAADLIIKVDREVMQNFATIDNRGTRFVGPLQATAGTRLNSLFGLADQTFFRAISTPVFPDELMAFDANNLMVLDSEGTTLGTMLNYARAHPGFTLRTPTDLDITSQAQTIGFNISRPIIRSRIENLRFNVQAVANDYKTTSAKVAGETGDGLLLRDKIRSLRAGAVYENVDTWRGANAVGFVVSHGFDILGATASGTDKLSRASGRSDYTKVTLEASRLQSLGGSWTFNAAFTSQYAFTPLLSSEQLGLGGSQYLRAYDPSDIVGDMGIGSKFELQYSESVKQWYLQDYQLYTYFDIGGVWNRKDQPGDRTPDAAISLGFGSRFSLGEWSSGYVEVSQPVMRNVPTESNHYRPRVFFAVIAKF